eukprot:UN33503
MDLNNIIKKITASSRPLTIKFQRSTTKQQHNTIRFENLSLGIKLKENKIIDNKKIGAKVYGFANNAPTEIKQNVKINYTIIEINNENVQNLNLNNIIKIIKLPTTF